MSFKSTGHDRLVIAGARAQHKGVGSINGQPGFTFLLTVVDGQLVNSVDLFRLKIWDSEGTVYDNNLGAEDGEDPTTVIAGGSIIIHKP